MSKDRIEKDDKMPKISALQDDIRFDEAGHWPQLVAKKGRYRKCKMTSQIKCMKCSHSHGDESGPVYLCLKEDHNCFCNYHSLA